MPNNHRSELTAIKTFPQLIRYLRDRMGWPIDGDDFEEMTFEYTVAELGIDPKNAAKIQQIKRLRPLTAHQPWGIFFVTFEPKRLPVVALRRILSQVALKKRASSNNAERTAWAADDVLFISNFGETNNRQITFAHFAPARNAHDLPTLKVLGWNDLDTGLHLDAVANDLIDDLGWPDDLSDAQGWRERWRAAFALSHGQVVTTSKELSIRLAKLARAIRRRTSSALSIETETGSLTKLMKAFQATLVHDLDADGFADMYAQTIAYGLLSARIAQPQRKTVDDFAAHMRTNPFLRDLMETFLKVGGRRAKAGAPGLDFDELGVGEVVQLLDEANMEAVVRDFGDKNPQEDPVIHFYELFLKEYDPKKRMQRGVFYTPRPIVSYIVRSVDELLRTAFGLKEGLADTTTWGDMVQRYPQLTIPEGLSPSHAFVQILDPATGTGTFLVEVIEVIHKTMVAKWKVQGHSESRSASLWNTYVPNHLLPRLHGYELLMAPYAIAHLKVGLKLYETGYRFDSDERARVYLTNALEPASTLGQHALTGMLAPLAHEAQAVSKIKREQRFTVVIGNPPYSGHSLNVGEWITKLVADYYEVDGESLAEKNTKWLQDDYVKFIRLGEFLVTQTGRGIQSFVTNHGYLDNPTFRGMRQHLMASFEGIDLLDLHGNSTKKERSPDGREDQNVFEIKQGVAVFAACRRALPAAPPRAVRRADLFGSQEHKYAELARTTFASCGLRLIHPVGPFYLFAAQDRDLWAEYSEYLRITQIMPLNVLGFQTHRDHFAVDIDKATLLNRLREFRDTRLTDAQISQAYKLADNRDWNVRGARRQLRNDASWKKWLINCAYRPFDSRSCYFSTVAMDYPRRELLDHVANRDNLCIGLGRQGIAVQDPVWSLVAISRQPIDANIFRRGGINVFPLWLYPQEGGLGFEEQRKPNLAAEFASRLRSALGEGQSHGDELPAGVGPESVVSYAYGLFHSLTYRRRYAEFLKIDFPHLPLPTTVALFRDLASLGEELISLHLMESSKLDKPITTYTGPQDPEVSKVGWSSDTVWLDAAATRKAQPATPGTCGFKGVPENIWKISIGGYQVCEKWLGDRKGRSLSAGDISHYQRIIVALAETIRISEAIDEVIEGHGGWPGAFAGHLEPRGATSLQSQVPGARGTLPMRPKTGIPEYRFIPPPVRKVAEVQPELVASEGEEPGWSEPSISVDAGEWMCLVRQAFGRGEPRDREGAIEDLAREAGFRRIGSQVREACDAAIKTAVRRGILGNESGQLRLLVRSVDGYERDFLKGQLLASLGSKAWTERDQVTRGLARWMGFRRTGAAIEDAVKSLVNGLLREGRLESDGTRIRKTP